MRSVDKDRRRNQRLRTRKDLLLAASRLLKAGRTPTMDEVADEALVSRATVYRYFPNIETLLVEAPLDDEVPDAQALFAGESSLSVEERIDTAEAALHAVVFRNEAQLRLMLAHSLTQRSSANGNALTPVRQNRRTAFIEEALAPVRDELDASAYKRLRASLALIFGTESMIVFRDVLSLDDQEARNVKSWAVRALVRAALEEGPMSLVVLLANPRIHHWRRGRKQVFVELGHPRPRPRRVGGGESTQAA